jgi:methylmalonyl-CoA/ethylmalonyl-CoA epimerase
VTGSNRFTPYLVNPELHHVAVVVSDLDQALTRYDKLGFAGAERFTLPEQAVEVATFRSGAGWIELIHPTDPQGPIARFLAKRGEGMHHVAYAVPDLRSALQGLEAAGVRLVDSEPRTGAHGWRIAFIHPESCGGVLTELVQE